MYFCCLQALQNVQRHANNAPCVVALAHDGSELAFEVLDEGPGYDVAATRRGLGLQIAQDRVDALGGTLEVTSSPGRTAVTGRLPTRCFSRNLIGGQPGRSGLPSGRAPCRFQPVRTEGGLGDVRGGAACTAARGAYSASS